MKRLVIFLLTLLIVESAVAAPYHQPTMAVLPFQLSPVIETVNFGDIQISRTVVEREFSNELANFLTKSRKFNLLSRTQITQVIDEYKLTESDWVDPEQVKKVGKLLVADYLVTGVINRLETNIIRKNIKITGETQPRVITTFKCQFQIIETATGKIKLSDQVIYKLRSVDMRREISSTERRDWTFGDYKDLLFSRTASEIGNIILASVYPIKVVEVRPREVILNRGKGAGINVGHLCQVIRQGRAIMDGDTGESLGGYESTIGTLEVTSVEAKFSKAAIWPDSQQIQVGDVCKLQEKTTVVTEPAYPKATLGW